MTMDPSERTERHPKHPGERGFGHGNTVTLELADRGNEADSFEEDDGGKYLPRGTWIRTNGDGTFSAYDDYDGGAGEEAAFDGVLKHTRYVGDEGSVHLQGVVRVYDNEDEADSVLDVFDDGDALVLIN